MDDFTLTVWQSGVSISARIECPAFIDQNDDLIDLNDVWPWAMQRVAQIDVFNEDG